MNIVVGIIFSIFSLFGAAYVTKDILTPLNELKHDSSIVKEIRVTYYRDKNGEIPQLDIYLSDKPYFIRVSTDYKKYWHLINNDSNLNKTIQYYYLNHVLREMTLSNPSQLSLDGKVAYAYGSDLLNAKLLIGLLILFFFLFLLITYFNIKAYRRKLITLTKVPGD